MSEEMARRVYAVLVEYAGARGDRPDRVEDFVYHIVHGGCEEYRFQGKLGFGGKFWPSSMRVDCYPEDETPKRTAIINITNVALAALRS